MTRFEKYLTAIKEYTDENNHNEAAMSLARYMEEEGCKVIMEEIMQVHRYKNRMPQLYIDIRRGVVNALIAELRNTDPDKSDLVYAAF